MTDSAKENAHVHQKLLRFVWTGVVVFAVIFIFIPALHLAEWLLKKWRWIDERR